MDLISDFKILIIFQQIKIRTKYIYKKVLATLNMKSKQINL